MMKCFIPLAAIFLFATACKKTNDPAEEVHITSFTFYKADNVDLENDINGEISSDSIHVVLPFDTDIKNLVPTIQHTGQGISPASKAAQNFTDPVTYKLSQADGTVKKYLVTVRVLEDTSSSATIYFNTGNANWSGFGKIYAIDAVSGKLKWKYETDVLAIMSTPVYHNGLLYTSIGNNFTAFNTKTKAIEWQFFTGAWTGSTALVSNNIAYVNAGLYLYAVNASNGNLIWKYKQVDIEDPGQVNNLSSPTVVDGIVYFGSSYNGCVYALDAATGVLKWKFHHPDYTDGSIECSPTVSNGVLYVGDNFAYLMAINVSDGSLKWSNTVGSTVAAPVVADGKVIVGTSGYGLHAYDALTGVRIWSGEGIGSASINASPISSGDHLYVGSERPNDGFLYSYKIADGSLNWMYKHPYGISGSPVVFDNTVFAGSFASFLAVDVYNGNVKWIFNPDSRFEQLLSGACIVDKDGKVYLPSVSGVVQ